MPNAVIEIPIDKIKPTGFSLRDLNLSAVMELTKSIKASGLLQPIMVKSLGEGYELIFGLQFIRRLYNILKRCSF